MIKDQPSQRGLWNRFHILSKKGEKRFSRAFDAGAKTKAYEFKFLWAGTPNFSRTGTSWVNNGERQGRATLPTLSIILKVSHCPRSETCFVLNPMIHTLGPNPQVTFNLRQFFEVKPSILGQFSIEPRQLWSFEKKFLEVILENKTDDITKAYNQIFKPKKGIPVMNVESKNCSIFPFIFLSFALDYNDLRAKPVFCSLYW